MIVLMGHGREGGQEFWFLRNSYGTGRGEGGHYKLAKKDASRCLYRLGYTYATTDGYEHTVAIKKSSGGGLPAQPSGLLERNIM